MVPTATATSYTLVSSHLTRIPSEEDDAMLEEPVVEVSVDDDDWPPLGAIREQQ